MLKWVLRGVLVIVALAMMFAGYLFFEIRRINVEPLTDGIWVLSGAGSNVAVLATNEGTVVVDSMTFPLQGRRIRDIAERLGGAPVSMVINTHYHLDHTHGNPGFEAGTRIITTAKTRAHLLAFDSAFWDGKRTAYLPSETFETAKSLSIGGQTIELLHPGPAHTNGDLIVHFVDKGVVHMGDIYFRNHYPNIDLEAGGTVQGWPAAIDAVLALKFDYAIPGHGEVTSREGLIAYQGFMEELGAAGRLASENGWTLEETLAHTDLQTDVGYTPISMGPIDLGLDRDFVITRAWEEATGAIGSQQ